MNNTLQHYEKHLKRILPNPKVWHIHTQGFETRVLMHSPFLSGQCQVAIFDKDCPYYCFGFLPCTSRHQGLRQMQSPDPLLAHKPITHNLFTQTVFVHTSIERPRFILCRDIKDDGLIEFIHLNLTKSETGWLPGLPENGSAFSVKTSDIKSTGVAQAGSVLLERADGPRRYTVWNKEPILFQYT